MRARLARAIGLGVMSGVAVSALAVPADADTGPAGRVTAARDGVIVYDQFRSGDPGSQIWTVDPVTGVESDLSRRHYGDDQPSISPNGKKIVFRSNNSIWTMTAKGGERTNLTPGHDTLGEPAWAPDGKHIVYVDNNQIATMKADGSDQHMITSGSSNIEPTWAPNGKLIAFTSRRVDGEPQLFTMKPNGSHVRDLSNDTTVIDEQPAWSPDSTHLLFTSSRSASNFNIFQMSSVGTDVTQVADVKPSGTYDPTYAPDGDQFAYTSNKDGNVQIFRQPLVGGIGQEQQVTSEPTNSGDENLSWQSR